MEFIVETNVKTIIVGFAGKNGSGKTTIGRILKDSLHHKELGIASDIVSFASAVKDCAENYFFWNGEKDIAGRHLLQWLGTDVGRAYDPDLWIKHIKETIDKLSSIRTINMAELNTYIIVIDDVRFDNEAEWIRNTGGYVFQVKRACETQLENHSSEQGVRPGLITEILDMDGIFASPDDAVQYLITAYFREILN
jgi:energy-coupling factor transporter ATP-binding protein EcfA2